MEDAQRKLSMENWMRHCRVERYNPIFAPHFEICSRAIENSIVQHVSRTRKLLVAMVIFFFLCNFRPSSLSKPTDQILCHTGLIMCFCFKAGLFSYRQQVSQKSELPFFTNEFCQLPQQDVHTSLCKDGRHGVWIMLESQMWEITFLLESVDQFPNLQANFSTCLRQLYVHWHFVQYCTIPALGYAFYLQRNLLSGHCC